MDYLGLIVALLSAGGFGALVKIILDALRARSKGIAMKDRERAADLVKQRNDAYAQAERERARANREADRADTEARNRNRLADALSDHRRICVEEHGTRRADLPRWPDIEETTLPPEEVRRHRDGGKA